MAAAAAAAEDAHMASTSAVLRTSRLARAGREMRPHAAQAASLLRALGNQQRLMILCHLVPGPLTVGEINARLPLSQSALSQHLGVLRDSGIVVTTRESQNIIYSLPPGITTRIIGLLQEEFCPR
jgi:DNA-binding transcriptional ArsR family regulator